MSNFLKEKNIEQWATIPDTQIFSNNRGEPRGIDIRAFKAVENCLKEYWWDGCVILGDFMDFNCISHFNKGSPGLVEGQTLAKDYKIANEILDRLLRAIRKKNPKAKIIYLEGNHEYRVIKYINENPERKGHDEVPINLRLKERDIRWVPYYDKNRYLIKGKLTFIHGIFVTDLHAKAHVMKYGTSIITGHDHDLQIYSYHRAGKNDNIVGVSMMCLCTPQRWEKGPNRWQLGWGVVSFWKNGYFQIHPIPINGYRFVFNNKEYKA